jgi:iron complex outermembrane recepter protein
LHRRQAESNSYENSAKSLSDFFATISLKISNYSELTRIALLTLTSVLRENNKVRNRSFSMNKARILAQLALTASLTTTCIVMSAGAFAQEATADEAPASGDVIIVTGTRRTDRTVADSSVPIDVISGDQLASTGLTETNKILNSLVPSFNFPQPSIADGTDVIRPASLRGLAPDQTLVLVNGKRRHVSSLINVNGTVGRGSAAVDLNLIPALAIERVEVLRDGASSQYGSDAIAGVINIKIKSADNGGKASISYGKYVTTLDGTPNVTGLQTDSGGQPILNPADNRYFLANTNGERKARDGEFKTAAVNIGVPIGGGFVNVTGEYRDRDATNRAGYDLRPNYNRPTALFDTREVSFNRLNFQFGDAKTVDYNVFVNAGVPVGENFNLYAFGSYGHRDGLSAANYRSASAAANRNFATITPATSPNAANFSPLTPNGFLPLIDSKLGDWSAFAGIKGELAGWNTDLSLGYGNNTFDYTVRNSLNTSFGTNSQSTFDAGGLEFGQLTANFDVSREFELGVASPVSLAFGLEYRDENFKIRAGDAQSFGLGPLFQASVVTTAANCTTLGGVFNATTNVCSFPGRGALAGAQGFPGFPASAKTDKSRDSYSVYGEIDGDIFDGFTATLAGRYEDFSDFGSTFNGKLALRYEPTEGLALRGSISNGFRAPSLHQQFFTTTSTNFIAGLPVEISTVPVDSPVARALGSKDLKPEKSTNISVGATFSPTSRLNFTIDYYNIKIKDRIVLTENLGAAGTGSAAIQSAVKAVLDANGFQSVGAARFFINGLETRTQGIDAVATFRASTGALGDWTLTAAYNLNDTKISKRLNALDPLSSIPGLVLFGRVEGIRFTEGQPKDKLVFSADGKLGGLGITARTTRFGEVVAPGAAAPLADASSLVLLGPDDVTLSPKWITDLELRYNFLERFELAVGANNLFDVYPDRVPQGARPTGGFYPANAGYLPYSGFSPFGFNGRFLYARASVTF